MINPDLRKDCPMRGALGNCLPVGGFCANAVSDEICAVIHNAYQHGYSDAIALLKGESKMGMDLYVYSARDREVFKHEKWWESEQIKEKFYAHNFWNLVENCSFITHDYEDGDAIELSLDNIEEMIKVACKYKDYLGTYDTVPQLCKLRDEYTEWQEDEVPRKLFLKYNW